MGTSTQPRDQRRCAKATSAHLHVHDRTHSSTHDDVDDKSINGRKSFPSRVGDPSALYRNTSTEGHATFSAMMPRSASPKQQTISKDANGL